MSNATAQDPFVNFTSDQAKQHLLLDIARRFKGQDPEVDRRIDAAAEHIAGRNDIKSIPPVNKGEPRVPLYMEGEPGVGKTTLIKAAILDFCKIAGLNFVENPEDGYQFGPKDFYYVTVNLSGKTNPMDIGGLPSKGELETRTGLESRRRAGDAGEWLLAEVASRTKMGAGLLKLPVSEGERHQNGGLDVQEVTIQGEKEQVDLLVNQLVKQLGEEAKRQGAALNLLKDDDVPLDGRLYLQVKRGTKGARIIAMAPQRMDADAEYVAEMLPNRRFAMASKAPFALFNFDDVANASESVRNVLLEVAQSNRYSGVMDIGNAHVTFTGNMGAEDGTNTQSEQSDAEVSRVFKVRVRDTPKAWASRIATKYATVGDCMMSSFIGRMGNQPGIFREAIGDMRTARGTPKPNSRSLENALAKMLPYFQMAKDSGVSPTVFMDEINHVVKGTTGPNVAQAYAGYLRAMLTEAIPLADELMTTGRLNEEKFEKHMGAGAKSSEQDFAFRFGHALADSFVESVAFSEEARKASSKPEELSALIAKSMDRMCTGLAKVEPGVMNDSLSRMMSRLGGIAKMGSHDGVEVKLTEATYAALAKGFSMSQARNIWVDAEAAITDFTTIVAGANLAGTKKKTAKP